MKKVLLVTVMILLFLPALQKVTGVISSGGLKGYTEAAPRPVFSRSSWFSGAFAQQLYTYINEGIGFRPDFVRVHNQLDYSLFKLPNAKLVVAGGEDCLYEEQYIHASLGVGFLGAINTGSVVHGLKQFQDRMEAMNILFVVVFAPDKGSFYPEFIPERYLRKSRSMTNYQNYRDSLLEKGVNFIDFSRWFINMKDTSRYILYPKTGIHWSSYGAFLAADSLRRYVSAKLGVTLPALVLDSVEMSDEPKDEDGDIMETLNLIWQTSTPPLAYPRFHVERKAGDTVVPALFIGDSFYWPLFKPGYLQGMFGTPEFWYYARDIYRGLEKQPQPASKVNRYETIARQKVIILLHTNAAYGYVGYDFVHEALKLPEFTHFKSPQ
jgi:hypothetical protein